MTRRRYALFACLALPLMFAAPAASAQQMKAPDAAASKALAQSTMAVFAKAVNEDNMGLLMAMGAPQFKQQVTADKLRENFREFIDKKIDLSGVARIEPTLSLPPEVDNDGVLALKGTFPDSQQTWYYRFRFLYNYPDWQLLGITVRSDPF